MSITNIPSTNTPSTNTPSTNTTPSLAGAINSITEWVAGEVASSPTILKLVGVAGVVVGAIPGDFKNQIVRSALVVGGYFLTSVVHYAEAKKKG